MQNVSYALSYWKITAMVDFKFTCSKKTHRNLQTTIYNLQNKKTVKKNLNYTEIQLLLRAKVTMIGKIQIFSGTVRVFQKYGVFLRKFGIFKNQSAIEINRVFLRTKYSLLVYARKTSITYGKRRVFRKSEFFEESRFI